LRSPRPKHRRFHTGRPCPGIDAAAPRAAAQLRGRASGRGLAGHRRRGAPGGGRMGRASRARDRPCADFGPLRSGRLRAQWSL